MTQYLKALIPLIGAVALAVKAAVEAAFLDGTVTADEVRNIVGLAVVAVVVYFVPNIKPQES